MLIKLNFNGKEVNVDIFIKLREINWKIDLFILSMKGIYVIIDFKF